MQYLSFDPDVRLNSFIVSFWIVTGDDKCSQKVLSDGYSELIFHFGDAYQIGKGGQWQTQSKALVAGQINKPVELQPSGASGMIGIKFTPTGLWRMFH